MLQPATKEGYTFDGWYDAETGGDKVKGIGKGYTGDVSLYAQWAPATDTAYKVEHYQKDVGTDTYTLISADTDSLTGTTGQLTSAVAKAYTGFTEKEFVQVAIEADGSTVVKIYYDRNEYTLTYAITGEFFANAEHATASYEFGAPVTAAAIPSQTGYTFVEIGRAHV